jgi:glycine/D-amino acid oxidase-like deaminating enzyme
VKAGIWLTGSDFDQTNDDMDESRVPHAVVIGGGLVGIASAFYLSTGLGYNVTVLEAHGDVAQETSYANAGP